jgi:simple sugar transport system permease protein
MAADANNAGVNIEVDAILAVVIGGTSLLGGKFSIAGTVVGVYIIQTLTSTITFLGIAPSRTPVFKAFVIIVICLLQSPKTRELLFRRRKKIGTATREPAAVEVSKPAAVSR